MKIAFFKLLCFACLLIISTLLLAEESVKFVNIADEAGRGIGFARAPSERKAIMDEIAEGSLLRVPDGVGTIPLYIHGTPGTAIFDYDNDGDLDLFATNGPGAANALYSNQLMESGVLTFIDVAEGAGVALRDSDCQSVCFGDIDNDGDADLYITTYKSANVLLENQGDGTFADISAASGTNEGQRNSMSAVFGDVNGDGLLDLFVGNYATFDTQLIIFEPFALNEHNILYLNRGGNRFEDVSVESGVEALAGFPPFAGERPAGLTNAVAMVDYDMDGDLDIFVGDDQDGVPPTELGGVDRGYIQLHRNDGTGHFENITLQAGLNRMGFWMGFSFGDFNHDGSLDFFCTNMGDYGGAQALGGLVSAASRWFLGGKDGVFQDVGIGEDSYSSFGWGTAAFDYDNDGDTDITYFGGVNTGVLVEASNPGLLLENDGQANFQVNHEAYGKIGVARRNVRGAAVGDLNHDGFVDVVTVSNYNFNASPPFQPMPALGLTLDETAVTLSYFLPTEDPTIRAYDPTIPEFEGGTLAVYLNDANTGNHHVEVNLTGMVGHLENARSNRDGIGAVVTFTPDGGKPVMKPILGGSSISSQHSLAANFGLGTQTRGTVEVLWPGGTRNRLYGVQAGERLHFPEIPVSFDTPHISPMLYEYRVNKALMSMAKNGVISRSEAERFSRSAVIAFCEVREHGL